MRLKNFVLIFTVLILSVIWLACASTKPDRGASQKKTEKQKVDEILDTKKAQEEKQKKDEDEVLRMLGITPEEETAKKPSSFVEEKESLESKAGTLEKELTEKEREIERLKKELAEKDKKMAELETVLTDLRRSPKSTTGASVERTYPAPTSGKISLQEYKRRYQIALQEYRNRNYNTAIRLFEELLQLDSNNSYSDNCQYWIGECYYALGMYQRALVEFEKVFAFVNSNKEDAAQLKIALCYKNLNQIDNAKEALQRLIVKYPKSEYIGLAKRLLAQL